MKKKTEYKPVDEPVIYFAENLRFLRRAWELSQMQLACLIGDNRSAVQAWESDKYQPDYATLVKLAKVFGISCDDLLTKQFAFKKEKKDD